MKFKIFLEYAGYNYSGWQKQPGQAGTKTVQGTLITAIEKVFKSAKGNSKFIDLQGSGRTDAGVHAIEQVAHLECESMLAPEILKMKINDELPSDINILEIEKAPKNFHARHDAKARQYLYVISKRRTALEKRYVWWIKDKLDVKKMKEAAKLFAGMHDFKNFTEKPPLSFHAEPRHGGEGVRGVGSTKCKVEMLEITETNEKILIRIKASHFLWKMVRRIVGTLVEIGRGSIDISIVSELLLPSPEGEGPGVRFTAPPSGLFLEKVYY
jgi:tRNA pseudouridine38-40 synthase